MNLPDYVANRGLFADRYLAEEVAPALPGAPGAPADRYTLQQATRWQEAVNGLWLRTQSQLSYSAENVREFVVAVYKTASAATRAPDRQQAADPVEPDLALFADSAAAVRAGAAPRHDRAARFAEALAVLDVVRRDTPLDSAADARLASRLLANGVAWGILTDGARWRLYRRFDPARPAAYFEVRLDGIFALAGAPAQRAAFHWFYAFLRPGAFPQGGAPGFLDSVLAGGTPAGPLTCTDAAEQVLARSGGTAPLHYTAITAQALALGLLTTRSRRPAAMLYAQILRDIAHRRARQAPPRFVKHSPGYVGLARWEAPANGAGAETPAP